MSYLNILFWDYICYNFLSFFIYTVLGKANQKKKKIEIPVTVCPSKSTKLNFIINKTVYL